MPQLIDPLNEAREFFGFKEVTAADIKQAVTQRPAELRVAIGNTHTATQIVERGDEASIARLVRDINAVHADLASGAPRSNYWPDAAPLPAVKTATVAASATSTKVAKPTPVAATPTPIIKAHQAAPVAAETPTEREARRIEECRAAARSVRLGSSQESNIDRVIRTTSREDARSLAKSFAADGNLTLSAFYRHIAAGRHDKARALGAAATAEAKTAKADMDRHKGEDARTRELRATARTVSRMIAAR